MTDLALQIAGSKLAISIVLGAAVWLVARGNERPRLCHALCLTLLAALLIPPLIALPMLSPATPTTGPADPTAFGPIQTLAGPDAVSGSPFPWGGRFGIILVWILGAVAMVGWTIVRARAFRGSLERASRGAPRDLQRMAKEVGRTLGLENVPAIRTTDAVVSPMMYWSGGTVRVLIPSSLLDGLEPAELRWILAHELAHVRRRDHLVRWLEWLACTVFWWNPIAWWARRRLRAAGELCCDALVVHAFGCPPHDYARSLVRALDLVRLQGVPRPPALASAAHTGRRTEHLEGRLRMIITNKPTAVLSPALQLVLRAGLVASLALGLVYCSDQPSPTAVEVPAAEVPTLDAPLVNLSVEDLGVVSLPPAEGLVPLTDGDVIPGTIRMSGTKYDELLASLDGLQACAKCHDGDLTAEERVVLDFSATVEYTDDGGWNLRWEFTPTHGDLSIRSHAWFPPATIDRVVVDQPPPPRR
ncbi:MAG: M56 family metallopeptidase [Gemmatimonadales bacterium]|nr:M56 family metallopeptidase [Candidatus Palauibacter irciniicola]MYC17005.1 M56 family metallopeptidase [Gemmatimonadales bacterium]